MNVERATSTTGRRIPGSPTSYRLTGKIIGVILAVTFGVGVLFQLLGHSILAGMTVALGVYLVVCSLLFILIPLIVLDVFFD